LRAPWSPPSRGPWHRDFERLDPEYHQRFLEFLGIAADEIRAIRERSRGGAVAP